MEAKKSFISQRLAAVSTAFLAFCSLVNGVFGPAWIPHVLIYRGDVRVLEEGIWLAKVCNMNGLDCYLAFRNTLFDCAEYSEVKSGMWLSKSTK